MRWKVPMLDDSLPHQLRIVYDHFHSLNVSCTCLGAGSTHHHQQTRECIAVISNTHEARVQYRRWHVKRGIRVFT